MNVPGERLCEQCERNRSVMNRAVTWVYRLLWLKSQGGPPKAVASLVTALVMNVGFAFLYLIPE